MIDVSQLNALLPEAQAAITAAQDRLSRAVSFRDTEDVVGRAKDLVESVVKVVSDQFGSPLGSDARLGQCARRAIEALGEDGSAYLGRDDSFKRLTSSLITRMEAIGSLRSSDGTGRGPATSSSLDCASATNRRVAAASFSLALAWAFAAAISFLLAMRATTVASATPTVAPAVIHEDQSTMVDHRIPRMGTMS